MSIMHNLSTAQAKKMDQLATMPWLKFDYTGYEQSEFRAANSPLARLAFVELTMRSIRTGFKLPKNDAALATWAGITKAQWAKVKDAVVSQFEDDGSHYICTSIAELYGEYVASNDTQVADEPPKSKNALRQERHRERKRNAQNSGDVTHQSVTCNANVTLPVTHVTPTCNADVTLDTVTSVTNGGIKGGDLDLDQDRDLNKDQNLKSTRAASQHTKDTIAKKFDVFWAAYPRKTDRKKALNAFTKINPSDDLLQTMLDAVSAWSSKWLAEPQYTPHPTTWLNGERWNDAPPPVATKPNQHKPSSGAVNQNWPDAQYTIPPSPETLAAIKKMQDEMEDGE